MARPSFCVVLTLLLLIIVGAHLILEIIFEGTVLSTLLKGYNKKKELEKLANFEFGDKDPQVDVRYIESNRVFLEEQIFYKELKLKKYEESKKSYDDKLGKLHNQSSVIETYIQSCLENQQIEQMDIVDDFRHKDFKSKIVNRVDRAGRLAKMSPIFKAILTWVDRVGWFLGYQQLSEEEALLGSEKTMHEIKDYYQFQLNQMNRVQAEREVFINSSMQEFNENEEQVQYLIGLKTEKQEFYEKKVLDNFDHLEKQKFIFDFHKSRVGKNKKSQSKLFEMSSDSQHFYLFTQSNNNILSPSGNIFNPYYSEITLSRFSQQQYLGNFQMDYYEKDFMKNVMDRQAQICLQDFVPGVAEKIAFNQVDNDMVAVQYRVLKENGYLYRIRVYDFKKLPCNKGKRSWQKNHDNFVESEQDIQVNLNDTTMYESIYIGKGHETPFTKKQVWEREFRNEIKGYIDFQINSTNSVSALSLVDRNTIAYSVTPDAYMFRVLKLTDIGFEASGGTRYAWVQNDEYNGPIIDRTIYKEYQTTSIQHIRDLTDSKLSKNGNQDSKQSEPLLFVTTMSGNDQSDLQTRLIGLSFNPNSSLRTSNAIKSENWEIIHNRYIMPISIRRGVDQFVPDIQQSQLAQYSNVHETNQMISVFSRHLLSVDWDYDLNEMYTYHSLQSLSQNKERKFQIESLSALPNNQKTILFTKKKKLYQYSRDYEENELYNRRKGASPQPKERLQEIKLAPAPGVQHDGIQNSVKQMLGVRFQFDRDTLRVALESVLDFVFGRGHSRNREPRKNLDGSITYFLTDKHHHPDMNGNFQPDEFNFRTQPYYKTGEYHRDSLRMIKHDFFPANITLDPSLQILDMLYKYNSERKCTVLIVLMEGGELNSFDIDTNFTVVEPFKQTVSRLKEDTDGMAKRGVGQKRDGLDYEMGKNQKYKKSSYFGLLEFLFGLYDEFPRISRIRLQAMRDEYRDGQLTGKKAVNHLLMFGIEYMYNCILIVFAVLGLILAYQLFWQFIAFIGLESYIWDRRRRRFRGGFWVVAQILILAKQAIYYIMQSILRPIVGEIWWDDEEEGSGEEDNEQARANQRREQARRRRTQMIEERRARRERLRIELQQRQQLQRLPPTTEASRPQNLESQLNPRNVAPPSPLSQSPAINIHEHIRRKRLQNSETRRLSNIFQSLSSSSLDSDDKTPRQTAYHKIKIGKVKGKREPRSTVSSVPQNIVLEKKNNSSRIKENELKQKLDRLGKSQIGKEDGDEVIRHNNITRRELLN